MKKLYVFLAIIAIFFTQKSYSQLLFEENFDYPAGDSITQHNWVAHSGATNMVIVSPGLTYTNYPSSGVGNAVQLDTVGISGMDVNRNFTEVTSGSVYASYMVKVLYATAAGEYYFHLGNTTLGFTFRPKLFVENDGGNVRFGISKGSNTGEYTTNTYLYNTTYLILVKYTFISGASNDEVSMFVFTSPNLPATEPTTPAVGPLTDPSQTDLDNAGTVALRQGTQSNRPVMIIDGIRITQSWGSVVEVKNLGQIASTFSLSQNYPNPFNPSTTIKFSIPEASFVTLNVYDVLGRELRNLVNENLNSGQYTVNFEASNLPSGVYFYKLNSVSNQNNKIINKTRSMILLK